MKKKNTDAKYDHIGIVRPRDDFIGGSFDYMEVTDNKGIWEIHGNLKDGSVTTEVTQRYEFNPRQFTPTQAKDWLKGRRIDIIKFIPASENLNIDDLQKDQTRIDFMFEEFMTDRFTETPEGFLTGRAVITNIGVFPYLTKDGTVIRELRSPEEVLNPDSLKSLQMSPLTNDHPNVEVNVDNIKQFQTGFIGDGLITDPYHISGPITITDKKAIEDVKEKGKRALSAGYTTDLVKKAGVWGGMAYDYVQTNIRYNHVAIVNRGRAGDDAVMKLDTVDGVHQIEEVNSLNIEKTKVQGKEELMKTIKIDGVDRQAEGEVIEELHKVNKKNDELNTEVTGLKEGNETLQGKCDSLEDENKQLKADNEKLKELDPEKFDKAVKAKIDLISKAKSVGVEVKDGDSSLDIKKNVIMKAYPNTDGLKEKLDEAGEAYIEARFDAAIELLDGVKTASEENKKKVSEGNKDSEEGKKDEDETPDPELAREQMIKDQQEAWKRDKE